MSCPDGSYEMGHSIYDSTVSVEARVGQEDRKSFNRRDSVPKSLKVRVIQWTSRTILSDGLEWESPGLSRPDPTRPHLDVKVVKDLLRLRDQSSCEDLGSRLRQGFKPTCNFSGPS